MSEPETEQRTQPNGEQGEPNAVGSVTFADAAALLGISPDAVRMRCNRGLLACETVGGRRRVLWPQPRPEIASGANAERTEQGEPRSVRSPRFADRDRDQVAALELRLAELVDERDRWRDAHADLSRQHDIALQLAAAANASLEQERVRTAGLESRLARQVAIAAGVAPGNAPVDANQPRRDAAPDRGEPDAPRSPWGRLRSRLRRR